MYYEKRTSKKGKTRYLVLEDFIEPLTGKKKRLTVTYYQNTSKARKQAERDLKDKIDEVVGKYLYSYSSEEIKTFAQLRDDWLFIWKPTVKKVTVNRELMILKRITELIPDDYLIERITKRLLVNILREYKIKYKSTHSTMQHIKSTLNKIFDHAVDNDLIPYSPSRDIRLRATAEEKKQKRERSDAKYLEPHEFAALIDRLLHRRNQNYRDLALFMGLCGLRVGEATALSEADFDFKSNTVRIDKSLQTHDLSPEDYYIDTTKTEASVRTVLLPKVAVDAVKNAIERGKKLDAYIEKYLKKHTNNRGYYRHSDFDFDFIFRTEYGSPISQNSFYNLLQRVNVELVRKCEKLYGFKWTKNAVTHSYRHIQATYLQDSSVSEREILARIGHANRLTLSAYTHQSSKALDQTDSVKALDKITKELGLVS